MASNIRTKSEIVCMTHDYCPMCAMNGVTIVANKISIDANLRSRDESSGSLLTKRDWQMPIS